jgi:hypothetical protein
MDILIRLQDQTRSDKQILVYFFFLGFFFFTPPDATLPDANGETIDAGTAACGAPGAARFD